MSEEKAYLKALDEAAARNAALARKQYDAEIPEEWMCKNGKLGTLIEGEGVESKPVKPPRTHWDMLLERRSIEELDVLLEERIEALRKRRRNAAKLLKAQQEAEEAEKAAE